MYPNELLTSGLILERHYDDRLWVFTLAGTKLSYEVVDAWEAALWRYKEANTRTKQHFLVYDFSPADFLYANSAFEHLLYNSASQSMIEGGRLAVVLGRMAGTLRPALESYIRLDLRHLQPKMKGKLFVSRDEAQHWILEGMGAASA